MDPSTGLNGVEAFTVSFMHPDPMTAMRVTARIADKFIQENSREREKDVEGTVESLDDELQRLKLELEKKEEQISQFKTAHIGELPQQTDANLRALDRWTSKSIPSMRIFSGKRTNWRCLITPCTTIEFTADKFLR